MNPTSHYPSPITHNRILFVVTQADWGGAQTFIFKAAREAMRRGFEVLLAYGGEGLLTDKCAEAGIPTRKLVRMKREISPIADIGAVRELMALMREWKPDVAFLNSSKAGVVGSIAGRLARVPKIIYRIGGWSFTDPVSPLQQQFRLWSEKLTAPLKDIIITNTPGQVELGKTHGITPRKETVMIPNGLDLTTFDAELLPRDEARRILDPDISDRPLIYTIANFYPAKGLPLFLDALAIVAASRPDVKTVIVGDGEERAMLEEKRNALNLEQIVALPGRRGDASTLLRGADLFVLPSRKEGFPWALLEAMAASAPSVATDVGGVRWMTDGTVPIVPPNDAASLAHAILETLNDLPSARIRATHARRIVEERFTEEKVWEGVFRLF